MLTTDYYYFISVLSRKGIVGNVIFIFWVLKIHIFGGNRKVWRISIFL